MQKIFVWTLFALAAGGTVSVAAPPAPPSASTSGDDLAKPLTNDSSIDDALDALQARGAGLKNFTASVEMTSTATDTNLSTAQAGSVVFENHTDGGGRIRVTFDKRIVGDMYKDDAKHEYILDGVWLTELDGQHRKVIKRQVLKPGQKLNLLKLGEGPFPLPIGQDKADVHAQFDVKKIAIVKDDPANTVHLQLAPKNGTQFERKFQTIDVFVDDKTGMPARIVTMDKNGTTERTTDLTDVKINGELKPDAFQVPAETDKWDRIEEQYAE